MPIKQCLIGSNKTPEMKKVQKQYRNSNRKLRVFVCLVLVCVYESECLSVSSYLGIYSLFVIFEDLLNLYLLFLLYPSVLEVASFMLTWRPEFFTFMSFLCRLQILTLIQWITIFVRAIELTLFSKIVIETFFVGKYYWSPHIIGGYILLLLADTFNLLLAGLLCWREYIIFPTPSTHFSGLEE